LTFVKFIIVNIKTVSIPCTTSCLPSKQTQFSLTSPLGNINQTKVFHETSRVDREIVPHFVNDSDKFSLKSEQIRKLPQNSLPFSLSNLKVAKSPPWIFIASCLDSSHEIETVLLKIPQTFRHSEKKFVMNLKKKRIFQNSSLVSNISKITDCEIGYPKQIQQ
jgi:hypothetical protein